MAIDFNALRVKISIIQNKLNDLSDVVNEAAEGGYKSDNLGNKDFTVSEKTRLNDQYEAEKLELKKLVDSLP